MTTSLPRLTRLAARIGICAAAIAGAAMTTTAAHATVVTTYLNTTIAVPANIDGVYLNFATGATGTAAFTGWDINMYLTNGVFTFFWNNTAPSVSGGVATAVTGGQYIDLAPGSVISSSTSTFSASSGAGGAAATSQFQTTGNHILGFRFYNEAVSAINYGYIKITNTAATGFPATITGWAYENSGAAITIPAVPEPESALMFAAGALALGVVYRRRQKRDAAV